MSTDHEFPWDIGIHDAHCHPTDTMASTAMIPHMKAHSLTVMATRAEDQDLVHQITQSINKQHESSEVADRIIPCFGWHPWFSHQILDDTQTTNINSQELSSEQKEAHYTAVLTPSPAEDPEFLKFLPTPKPLSELITETRERLESFPYALVGEIGLDKSFRLPSPWTTEGLDNRDDQLTPGSRENRRLSPYKVKMEHQKTVLKSQLRLAGEMQRAVSVHSVQAHGAVFDTLKGLWAGHEKVLMSRRDRERRRDAEGALSGDEDAEDMHESSPLPFPPRICMHSYSGPVEQLRQFLNKTNPSDVYFSFSCLINFSGPGTGKVVDVVKMLPEDRILIESDLHTAGPSMDDLLEQVARQVCEVRGWELRRGVQQLADNWKRFVFG
ncbi:TatD family [Penicillium longicatenatum]|uniref:TatD family n=1 Tax=Penicillium longicatenatum TaxID=1561947 RepID=UPI0025486B42|nr:TatD family [Penicillium longicatenatum]KAJ5636631.1 TatD family [Penicillium longicatenatum]